VTDGREIPPHEWAAALLAVDPGLGGICLRAPASPAREAFLAKTLSLSAQSARRVPIGASDDRVFGGLDLAATLSAGRPVHTPGLVAEIGDGTLVIPMAERMAVSQAARLGQAQDAGAPVVLTDRLAFLASLPLVPMRDREPHEYFKTKEVEAARRRLGDVVDQNDPAEVMVRTAAALGIASLRAPHLALRAARAMAALLGLATTTMETLERAAALVLAPRATQLPDVQQPEEEDNRPPEQDAPDVPPEDSAQASKTDAPEDLVLEAARAAIPPDVLARLAAQGALARAPGGAAAGAGDDQKGAARGRPAGVRRGDPRSGARLDLVATLRTAAPWQPLRRRMGGAQGRVLVTAEDFRVKHYKQKREKVVIFVVDASGSAALTRLAETKGAIELLLAEAYVRREQVALIAFRGEGAELLLPPTRSLVQAKRRLSALPGGGGTPLAAGLEAAALLAEQIRRRGQTPHIALMTDGRANIARDGAPGRPQAMADAEAAGRMIRAARLPSLLIDTAPRPQPAARSFATVMGALYLPLPRADAQTLDRTLRSALSPAKGAA